MTEGLPGGARERLEAEFRAVAQRIAKDGAPTRSLRPVDAATLILIDHAGSEAKVLMGRRNAAVKFMPNKFVFPGGRLDPADRSMPVAGILEAHVERRLTAGSPGITPARARALALTAIRETYEETGIFIGTKEHGAPEAVPAGSWQAFLDHGVLPDLEGFRFVARAVTPPGRSRRFDTRFFVVDARHIGHRIEKPLQADDELTEIGWIPLSTAQTLDVPGITHVILDELALKLKAGIDRDDPVPFYRQRHGAFIREEV